MEKLTVMPFLLAMFVAVAAMPTNVYQVCAWNAGTLEVEPWRSRTTSVARRALAGLRAWCASLMSPRLAVACLAFALLTATVAHAAPGHHAHILAAVTPLATLQTQRATALREAEALRIVATDGAVTFKDDSTRAAFDTKMADVDRLDGEIRQAQVTPPVPAATGDNQAAIQQGVEAERARAASIISAVRVAKLDDAFAADLVQRGVTIDAARAAIFTKMAEASSAAPTSTAVAVGEAEQDKWLRGATNWLLHKSGAAELVARATKVEVATMDPGEFRGLTLLDMARQALERGGKATRGLDKMRLVSEALTFRGAITQSTSDFAVLLENVMNKVLLAAYAVQPDTWRRFCATSTVPDFRVANRYRLGTFGSLDSLTESGEFKNKTITDAEKSTTQATTKGNIINVSRQMIVNDDLGAFSKLLTMLGRAAALSVEVDVYALLAQNGGLGPNMADGHPLFDAAHGNVGVGAALSAASIDADRVLMGSQKDKDGNEFLDLRPAIALVPISVGGQARVINLSQYDPDNIANKAQMRPNVVAGLFRDIVDTPRIAGTRRYAFADTSVAEVLDVAFLEGQSSPVLESQDGWRSDGAEMKVRFDYGVAAVDFRGATTNAGA